MLSLRKKIVLFLSVTVFVLGISGIVSAAEKITIRVWKSPWLKGIPGEPLTDKSTYLDWYLKLGDDFNKIYPNVSVKWTQYGWGENRDKINAGILTGNLPDITYDSGDVLLKYYYQEVGESIDKYLTEEDRDDYFETSLKAATAADGKIAYWPTDNGGPIPLIANKTIFEERGATNLLPTNPDRTWTVDQFLKAVQAVTFDQDGDGRTDTYGIGVQFKDEVGDYTRHGFLWSMGATMFSPDGKKFTLNSEAAEKGLQLLFDLEHKYHVLPPGSAGLGSQEIKTMFWRRQIAIVATSIGDAAEGLKVGIGSGTIKAEDFELYVLSYPNAPGAKPRLFASEDGWLVFSQTDEYKRKMVMEFARFLSNTENQRLRCKGLYVFPVRESVGQLYEGDPLMSTASRLLKYAVSDWRQTAYMHIRKILLPMYQSVMTKEKTPKQALEEAGKRALDIMSE